MLIDARRLEEPTLAAGCETIDVRTPHLRVVRVRARNVASDFRLLAPTLELLFRAGRSGVTVVLDGRGRFDELGRHGFLGPGDMVLNDHRYHGTEAYVGRPSSYVVLEWEDGVSGTAFARPFSIQRLSAVTLERVRAAAAGLDGPAPAVAASELVDLLAAEGAGVDRIDPSDLASSGRDDHQGLQSVLSRRLAALHEQPSFDEVAAEARLVPRQAHRRIRALAATYSLPYLHWRKALHQARLVYALRLLGAPGATTELVARLTGFRAPTALCHAFAKAGLPSPMRLGAAARKDALEGWLLV